LHPALGPEPPQGEHGALENVARKAERCTFVGRHDDTGGNKLTELKGERKMGAIGYNCIGMMWEYPNFPTNMR